MTNKASQTYVDPRVIAPEWATNIVVDQRSGHKLYARLYRGVMYSTAFNAWSFDPDTHAIIEKLKDKNYSTPYIKGMPMPEWATHIVADKNTGDLFYARTSNTQKEWYVGPGNCFEFHPAGYNCTHVITEDEKAAGGIGVLADPIDGMPTAEFVPCRPAEPAKGSAGEVKFEEGQNWLVRGHQAGNKHLTKMTVISVHKLSVQMRYSRGGSIHEYFENAVIIPCLVEQI